MSKSYGGFLIQFDEQRRASLLGQGVEFSDALSASDWDIRQWEVCGLMFKPGAITHWALARRGNRIATDKFRVEFTEIAPAGTPLIVSALQLQLSFTFRQRITQASSGLGGRLTAKAWDDLTRAVSDVDAKSKEALVRLEKLRVQSRDGVLPTAGLQIVGQQRDAVGLALSIFEEAGELRRSVLRGWTAPTKRLRSFLEDVPGGAKGVEDQMIARDVAVFPGARDAKVSTVGRVFRVNERVLEVFNVNRTRMEQSTGVDLIYHNQTFDAWTLVQYKCMEQVAGRGHSACFRPDKGFDEQLVRMDAFNEMTVDNWTPSSPRDGFRLSSDGFYFKFCLRVELPVFSDVLLKGMYLPREYLKATMADLDSRGPRDGRVLTYPNVKRHITNTLFAPLVRDGWIGTRGLSSELVANTLQGDLASGRALVLAVERKPEVKADMARTLRDFGISTT